MERLTIREIAGYTGGRCERTEDLDRTVCAISTDSREPLEGAMFIALEGERFDGHDFVHQAFCKGAVCALCHKDVPDAPGPIIRVADTGRALLDLAAGYRSRFSLPVVGVTGSVGKTTTKEMVYAALSGSLRTHKSEGNHNNEIGLPKTVLELSPADEAMVVEMGMYFPGEIRALAQVARPTVGVITNIGVAHIENLGSRENILKAKLEILGGMPADGTLILNRDNDLLAALPRDLYPDIRWYAIEAADADCRARDIRQEGECTHFVIETAAGRYPASIPTIGQHNVLDALAGFAAACAVGVAPEEAARSLGRYEPAGMRQKIVRHRGMMVIEDCYNASPDSVRAALETLCSLEKPSPGGRRIAVLGDMTELGAIGPQAHEEVGRLAARMGVDLLYGLGELSRRTVEGAKAAGLDSAYAFSYKQSLYDALRGQLREGDIILLKGSRVMQLEEILTWLYREGEGR